MSLEANVGRPRTALVVGRSERAAQVLRDRGATVTTLASLGGARAERFDLVVVDDDGDATLRDAAALLTDGGHVVGDLRDARGIADRLRAAGLELLRLDPPRRGSKVFVSRKPPAKGKLSLTVGMLTLNEKDSVERMIDDIRAVAPDAKILLIDSSSDETPELAKAKGARVVRQLPPRGHGPAMERLMYEAASDTDALIYIDCDFTYPTHEIPRIRRELEEGADVVNASRTSRYPKAMPVPNFIANRVFAGVARAVHGIPTTDVHSGMRGYRSSVTRAFSFDGEGDALPLDTLILPARSNYNVLEFPIEYSERVGESKLAKFRGTAWTFIRIAKAVGKGDRVRRGRRYVTSKR